MIRKIIKFLFNRKEDPVKYCEYYRKNGCVHVDGFLCPCNEMEVKK